MSERGEETEEGHEMALPATEPPHTADDLLEVFDNLAVPAGYRAELIEGEIVVSPPPDGDHEHIVAELNWQVSRRAATELYASGAKGIITPSGRLVPDSTIGPRSLFRGRDPWMRPDGVAMVVEVTSTRAGKDREVKRQAYAEAEIPLYLLVDRGAGEAICYSEPADGTYRADIRVPFGKGLDLPEPFGFPLDTASFRSPA